jgi:hypothetical protein|tara:strand:- start:422 stop:1321 length:900 start_codon:yes stop_codon:yes gene_type:complete
MAAFTAIAMGVMGAASLYQTYKANQAAKGMQAMSEEQFIAAEKEKAKQQAELDKQKDIYRNMKFENPYAEMENQFAGLENVYEDLRVGTGAADFQMEQGAQQRANILQGLRGAAGGSGVAGLAQSLAGQGALQARQVSVGLEQQQLRNEALRAQGAMSLQQMEAQGATAADMAQRGGEAMLQEAESGRQATLLGMQYGSSAGANAALQQAQANQMSSMANQMQMHSDAASTYMQMGVQAAGMHDWGGGGGGMPRLSSEGTQESLISDQGSWYQQKYGGPNYGPSQYDWGLKPPTVPYRY